MITNKLKTKIEKYYRIVGELGHIYDYKYKPNDFEGFIRYLLSTISQNKGFCVTVEDNAEIIENFVDYMTKIQLKEIERRAEKHRKMSDPLYKIQNTKAEMKSVVGPIYDDDADPTYYIDSIECKESELNKSKA